MYTTPSPTEFLKTAATTASHFGFSPLTTLIKEKRKLIRRKASTPKISAAQKKVDALYGILAGGVSAYVESRLDTIEEPALFFSIDQVPRTGEAAFGLHIIGVERSIAEALLIQTLRSFLTDIGYPNQSVRINSLGDHDSMTRYTRELTNYLKKRLDDMPPQSRELMKEHVVLALMDMVEREHELARRSPSPMEYLSDASRKHFREIIEYLDMSETPYEIDNKLLGHHHCYSDAIFSLELRDENMKSIDDTPMIVRGGRYNAFAQRAMRREIPAVGAVAILKERRAPARTPRMAKKLVPSVFVVQLGFGPKIRSLLMLDELKRANIPVYQNLASDSLSAQLRLAETYQVPFAVILGQKEYVENTVIVRNMSACSQECIPKDSLVSYLKRVVK